jgi:Tfp pilus assembly protein PilV
LFFGFITIQKNKSKRRKKENSSFKRRVFLLYFVIFYLILKKQKNLIMIRFSIKNEDGVSLLELILAIAIFVVSSASIAHLYIGAQTSIGYSVDKTQAIFLAKEGIEQVRAERGEDFSNLTSKTINNVIILDGKEFQRQVEISCAGYLCIVDSTINWSSFGKDEQVNFTEHLTSWVDDIYSP